MCCFCCSFVVTFFGQWQNGSPEKMMITNRLLCCPRASWYRSQVFPELTHKSPKIPIAVLNERRMPGNSGHTHFRCLVHWTRTVLSPATASTIDELWLIQIKLLSLLSSADSFLCTSPALLFVVVVVGYQFWEWQNFGCNLGKIHPKLLLLQISQNERHCRQASINLCKWAELRKKRFIGFYCNSSLAQLFGRNYPKKSAEFCRLFASPFSGTSHASPLS